MTIASRMRWIGSHLFSEDAVDWDALSSDDEIDWSTLVGEDESEGSGSLMVSG